MQFIDLKAQQARIRPQIDKHMCELRVRGQDRRYYHARIGINGRMGTLQAAILLANLEILDEEISLRQRAAALCNDLLLTRVDRYPREDDDRQYSGSTADNGVIGGS